MSIIINGQTGIDVGGLPIVDTNGGDVAPLASPALTGTPTAPTATVGTNTTQLATTAFAKTVAEANAIGVGQTWQDMTSQRVLGTTYTNTTGKPIQISVSILWYSNNSNYDYITVNGVIVAKLGTDNSSTATSVSQLIAVVPDGGTYSVTALRPFKHWAELR